jgi:DNA-binding CsgD family transcriptional regulator
MTLEERALRVVERIYDAAVDPDRWQEFVQTLSEAYDNAPVAFGLNYPGDPLAGSSYLVGILPEYRRSFAEHLIKGLPFTGFQPSKRFIDMGDLFPEIELSETEFYREWMKPQDLAPVWPIGAGIWLDAKRPAAWLQIWRAREGSPFGREDLALGDRLLPHLERALGIHVALLSSRREGRALGEVIDRFPTGVFLLDAERQVVSTNLSADRILALRDGFRIDRKEPRAENPRDNAGLKQLIASSLDPAPGTERQPGGFTNISRPSGKRSFVAYVTPLLAAPSGSPGGDAVAVLFVDDLEPRGLSLTEMLATLYELTQAEAELVSLLAEGNSLDQAAAKRGVTINTARGQLKQVFSKTDTKRQGELVRLVLTGVGTLRDS